MSSLTSIPLELLNLISTHLSTPELGSLRLTCKHIEKSIFDNFAKEFFSKKQFMLTQPSLQALVDISKHPSLSRQLKHVIIGLEQYRGGLSFDNSETCDRYRQGYADQCTLLSIGLDRELLTEAFQNLPNLETVGIRDFVSRGRLRDGDAPWNSYGYTTILKETGHALRVETTETHLDYVDVGTRIFTTLLYALGKAARTPPAFEAFLRNRSFGLRDTAFNVPDFLMPTVEPVLRGMKRLLLALNTHDRFAYIHVSRGGGSLPGVYLQRFLSHTPNLTHLRLNFDPNSYRISDNFLQWLAQPVNSSSRGSNDGLQSPAIAVLHPRPIALAHLERIDLGKLKTEPSFLLDIITKFAPTLKAISLFRVSIRPPPGVTFSPPYDQSKNLWSGFFSSLANIPYLELNYLLFDQISLMSGSRTDLPAEFRVLKDGENVSGINEAHVVKDESAAYGARVERSGKEMKTFLKGLAVRVRVAWPEVHATPSASENSDDEEMSDDDDDDDEEDDNE